MLGIHKAGQGYWTRLLSALGFGAVVAAGAMWLYTELEVIDLPREYQYEIAQEPENLAAGDIANLYMDEDGDTLGATAPVREIVPPAEGEDTWTVVLGDLARDADANDASFTTVVSLGPQQAPAAAGTTAYEIGERSSVETVNRQMVQGGAAIGLIVVGALALLYLCYANPKTVDFLIATEGEMKKVNWSSRREVLGSTWVVIAVSIIIAAVLLGADVIFSSFFTQIGVLER